MYFSSSSVTLGCSFLPPRRAVANRFIAEKNHIAGVSIVMQTESGAAISIEKLSAFSLARLFGSISPKISTSTVMTRVAAATLPLPNCSVKSTVASDEAEMFTTLLPMSIAVSALSKFSVIFSAFCALLLPEVARFLRRMWFAAEKAVSVAEHTADIAKSRHITTIFILKLLPLLRS